MKRPGHDLRWSAVRRRFERSVETPERDVCSTSSATQQLESPPESLSSPEMHSSRSESDQIRCEIRKIVSHLAFLTDETIRDKEHCEESNDWKFAAMVLDRLCFILFTVSVILFTSLTLLSALT